MPRTMLAFFDDLATRFPILGLYHSFPSSEAVIASTWAPLGLATLACILLVLLLARPSALADEALLRLIFNWSLAFAAVCLLAFPVFTQDMWLSAVWGRMISAGINPYYQLFTPDTVPGLPLDHFPMVMSYGPLWGVISAIVMLVAGNSVLAAGILFKAVLAAAWIGSLALIERITADPAGARAMPCHRHVRLGARQRVAVAGRGPQRHRADVPSPCCGCCSCCGRIGPRPSPWLHRRSANT